MLTGIIGYGYVGQATHKLIGDVDIIIDIDSKSEDWDKAKECDVVFICVPTPQSEDGSADTSIVKGVISRLGTKPVYAIRSTIPWTFQMPGYRLVANPEFLNQNEFLEDSDAKQLLGGVYKDIKPVADLYREQDILSIMTTWSAAWKTKYTSNMYGAFKVSFWEMIQDITGNERLVYALWHSLGLKQRDMAQVGMDGNRGYGGACFPKDLNAMLSLSGHELLKAVVQYNDRIHNE